MDSGMTKTTESTDRSPATSTDPAEKRRSDKAGMPPGSLVHIGTRGPEKVTISVIDYTEAEFQQSDVADVQDLAPYLRSGSNTWICVRGLHQTEIIEAVGRLFKVHPLFLEDVVNTSQRPKIEDAGDYLFIVLKTLYRDSHDKKKESIIADQLSLVLGPNFLLSFEERKGSLFDPVIERLRAGKGRIRKAGTDYLAYAVIDAVVDNYFVLLEKLADKIEFLEEDVVTNATPDLLRIIHKLKTDMIFLRRSVWPLREVINRLAVGESPLIKEPTRPYFRDVYDHTIHVIDTLETFRDIVSGMLDIYLSSVSNKLNEIMKVLTIIATMFIPLTFLVGWYGMNFKNMPELEWRWGYPMVMVISVCTVVGLLLFFRRKRWL